MTPPKPFALRTARREDITRIEALIERSVRELSTDWYVPEQIESALRHMFGVDTQLVDDGTYYVVEAGDVLAAAGGWSKRRTLFGGDRWKHEADDLLDPGREPARIRAFFVEPAWARQGLGRTLFETARDAALTERFRWMELMATLPGEPLYRALGFTADERIELELPDGVRVPLVRMTRAIGR